MNGQELTDTAPRCLFLHLSERVWNRLLDAAGDPRAFRVDLQNGECYANLECKVVDTRMVSRYNFFILEVFKAWIDPSRKAPRTIHHLGRGAFMVAGRTIMFPSKMK